MAAARLLVVRGARALEHHPKQVTALLAALMLGGGGAAFAVADSLNTEPPVPVRQIVEDVEPLAFEPQREALQAHPLHVWRSETVRSSDSVDSLLARLGVTDAAAAEFLRRDPVARSLLLTRTGRTVTAQATQSRDLVQVSVRTPSRDPARFQRLVVERTAKGFQSRVELAPYTTGMRVATGVIQSSLFAAADEAAIPDDVTLQMVDMFGGDIDFHRGLRRGDRFNVVYEVFEADGEVVRGGKVLTAEFGNAGRVHRALWYQEGGQPGAYYDFNGQSLERAFLASPMEISRVTSGFSMRFHPIRQVWAAHRGVDYGAPAGAPVVSVGAGRVEFAGWMGGYGNVVQVDHGRGDVTLYAHLSRIEVRAGAPITRGQRLGAVGATGWATGPHLHFEFRQNGTFKDPLEVARAYRDIPMVARAGPAFDRVAHRMRLQLAAASGTALLAAR